MARLQFRGAFWLCLGRWGGVTPAGRGCGALWGAGRGGGGGGGGLALTGRVRARAGCKETIAITENLVKVVEVMSQRLDNRACMSGFIENHVGECKNITQMPGKQCRSPAAAASADNTDLAHVCVGLQCTWVGTKSRNARLNPTAMAGRISSSHPPWRSKGRVAFYSGTFMLPKQEHLLCR